MRSVYWTLDIVVIIESSIRLNRTAGLLAVPSLTRTISASERLYSDSRARASDRSPAESSRVKLNPFSSDAVLNTNASTRLSIRSNIHFSPLSISATARYAESGFSLVLAGYMTSEWYCAEAVHPPSALHASEIRYLHFVCHTAIGRSPFSSHVCTCCPLATALIQSFHRSFLFSYEMCAANVWSYSSLFCI